MSQTSGTVDRVKYGEGQVLTAADLLTEQEYLIEMRRRHAVAHHRWGVAQGLDLSIENTTLRLSPGNAVDGYGRQLIVPEVVETSIAEMSADQLSVWLSYGLEPIGNASRGRNIRWQEVTRLRVAPRTEGDPRDPSTTPTDWPVFLGSLQRSNADGAYSVNLDGRPYIALAGETLRAASGAAEMRCASDFAVSLPISGTDPPKFADSLRIDTHGNLCMVGDANLIGNVHLLPDSSTPSSARAGLGFAGATQASQGPKPWSIYRTSTTQDKLPPIEQLVIELPSPRDKQDPNGLTASIGATAKSQFAAGLTVNAAGDVVVSGVLRIGGQIVESPVPADPSDPRFLVALVNASSGAAADVEPGPLTVKIGAAASGKIGAVSYSLSFANGSDSAIQIFQVQEFVTLNDQLIPGPPEPMGTFSLDGSQTRTFDRQLQAGQSGTLKIGVRALASGPNSEPLAAKDGAEMQVSR